MKLEELKRELAAIADELVVDPSDEAIRVPMVRKHVRTVRRAKLLAAAGSIGVVTAALLVVPDMLSGSDNRELSPADRSTVIDDGVVFREESAGRTLIGHAVGEPGANQLTLTVSPQTSDVAFVFACWRVGEEPELLPPYRVLLNGEPVALGDGIFGSCTDSLPDQLSATIHRESLRQFEAAGGSSRVTGVGGGRPLQLTVDILGADSKAGLMLAAGVYATDATE